MDMKPYSEKGSLPPPKKKAKKDVSMQLKEVLVHRKSQYACIVVGPNDMVVTNFLWVHIAHAH